jgi:hypothetical protein
VGRAREAVQGQGQQRLDTEWLSEELFLEVRRLKHLSCRYMIHTK